MKALRPTRLLAAGLLLASLSLSPLTAQMTIRSTGDGGAIPGTTTIGLTGKASSPFLLLMSNVERKWQPIPGLELEIDINLLPLSIATAGFVSTLDTSGNATAKLPVPGDPALAGMRLSFQSIGLNPLGDVSNLLRVTLQQPDTFANTLGAAIAPILTGKGFVQKDGKVLLLGGSGPIVQEYDPNLERFRVVGAVPSGNILATQTQLQDGKILVTGGIGLNAQPAKTAFLFDPATGRSVMLPEMSVARAGHAAALLRDGRVLIVGGAASLDFTNLVAFLAGIQNTSEFFDPKTGKFTPGPALLEKKMFHTATTLGNGEVLVAGGLSVVPIANIPIVSPLAQAYTPSLGIFGLPRLMTPRMLHGATALGNGRALLAGGLTIDFTEFLRTQNIADLKVTSVADAVTYRSGLFGGFSQPIKLGTGRLLPAVAPLGNDGALIAGGFNVVLSTSEIKLEPLADSDLLKGSTVTPTGKMTTARTGAVAVPLPDGTVLVTGGSALASEIFQPK